MDPGLTLTDAPSAEQRRVIGEGLRRYNEEQAGYSDSRELAVLVSDPETKEIVGGLLGRADEAASVAGLLRARVARIRDIGSRTPTVRTLALDKTPRDGEFGYDGKVFYFTQAGVSSVQVLDPASDRIVEQIPTGVSPHFVSYPRGSAFGIVVVQGPSELLLFDPATNKPARSIAVGKQPHWATASGDGPCSASR